MAIKLLLGSMYSYNESCVSGGIEAVSLHLAQALAKRPDVNLHVASFHSMVRRSHTEKRNNITFHWFNAIRYGWSIRAMTIDGWRFCRFCERLKPDIIHAQGTSEYSTWIPHSVPMVLTIHGLELFETVMRNTSHFSGPIGVYRYWFGNKITQRSIRNASAVVSIAEEYIPKAMDGLLKKKSLYFIPNPIDDFWFDSVKNCSVEPIVLSVGSIIERKNNLGLVQVFSKVVQAVPTAKLWFAGGIGEPAYFQRVLKMVRSMGLNDKVQFLGSLNESELKRKYAEASIVALTSIQETMPMALAQAMAMGKAVVATRIGGVPSMIVNKENGILVDLFDWTTFADQIIRLLRDDAFRRRLGMAAREFVKLNYQSDVVAEKTVQMYKTIIVKKRKKN